MIIQNLPLRILRISRIYWRPFITQSFLFDFIKAVIDNSSTIDESEEVQVAEEIEAEEEIIEDEFSESFEEEEETLKARILLSLCFIS